MFRNRFKSIYVRFILVFFWVLIISNVAAPLMIFRNITQEVYQSLTENLTSSAYIIKNLVEKKNIPLEEVSDYVESNNIINVFNSYEDMDISLSNSRLSSLAKGEPVFLGISHDGYFFTSVILIEDRYVIISPNIESNPLLKLRNIEIKMTVFPLLIGALLIAIAVRTIVMPIKRISNGSKEVANGNFDFQLKVKGKDEIAELTKNFNLMIKELSKNEYLHKNFVSNVSHEFKTPIASLRGYAKLLKDDNLTNEEKNQYADIIISASERLSNLSTNLLRLAELENGNFVKKNVTFSLSEQIRSCIILMQNQWEEKDLELNLDMDEITYTGDEELLYIVWFNLISNAIKYSEKGDSLTIFLKKDDKNDGITFLIEDDGIGISKEDLGNVFTKFFKVDKSRNSKGTGLGLPIAKKIVEVHDGEISVESEAMLGTTFTVKLR